MGLKINPKNHRRYLFLVFIFAFVILSFIFVQLVFAQTKPNNIAVVCTECNNHTLTITTTITPTPTATPILTIEYPPICPDGMTLDYTGTCIECSAASADIIQIAFSKMIGNFPDPNCVTPPNTTNKPCNIYNNPCPQVLCFNGYCIYGKCVYSPKSEGTIESPPPLPKGKCKCSLVPDPANSKNQIFKCNPTVVFPTTTSTACTVAENCKGEVTLDPKTPKCEGENIITGSYDCVPDPNNPGSKVCTNDITSTPCTELKLNPPSTKPYATTCSTCYKGACVKSIRDSNGVFKYPLDGQSCYYIDPSTGKPVLGFCNGGDCSKNAPKP